MARPTRLTDEAIDRFIQGIRAGAFPEVAARYAGFSPRTLYRYLRGSSPTHAAFREKVVLTRTELEMRLGGTVVQAGYGDPRWALAYLERHFPERWRLGSPATGVDPAPSTERPGARSEIALDPAFVDAIVPKLLEAGARLRGAAESDGPPLGRFETRSPGASSDPDREQ
jgi:hypothetical protein